MRVSSATAMPPLLCSAQEARATWEPVRSLLQCRFVPVKRHDAFAAPADLLDPDDDFVQFLDTHFADLTVRPSSPGRGEGRAGRRGGPGRACQERLGRRLEAVDNTAPGRCSERVRVGRGQLGAFGQRDRASTSRGAAVVRDPRVATAA